jgi:dTMP kinase
MAGLYVVFEGIDGSGKSTLFQEVCRRCDSSEKLLPAGLTYPSHRDTGKFLRSVLQGKAQAAVPSLLWLFVADAVDQEPVVLEKLQEGRLVLADRHPMFSGRVYQTEVHPHITVAHVQAEAQLRAPDLVVFVDTPPEVALARMSNRSDKPADVVYEGAGLEVLHARRALYLKVLWASMSPLLIVNGALPLAELAQRVCLEIACRREGP